MAELPSSLKLFWKTSAENQLSLAAATKAIRLKPRGAAVISTKGSSVFSIQAERCLSNARYAVDGG